MILAATLTLVSVLITRAQEFVRHWANFIVKNWVALVAIGSALGLSGYSANEADNLNKMIAEMAKPTQTLTLRPKTVRIAEKVDYGKITRIIEASILKHFVVYDEEHINIMH